MIEIVSEFPAPVSVKGEYELTERDFYEAQAQGAGLRGRALPAIGLLLLVCIAGEFFFHRELRNLIGLPFALLMLFGTRLSTHFTFKREKSLRLRTTVSASEIEVRFANSSSEGTHNWSAFVRFAETKHLFLLYPQSKLFLPIPKRAFSSDDVVALRGLLQRRIANTGRRVPEP